MAFRARQQHDASRHFLQSVGNRHALRFYHDESFGFRKAKQLELPDCQCNQFLALVLAR